MMSAPEPDRAPDMADAADLLLIDDDFALARMVSGFLTEQGFNVLHAPDGARALQIVEERPVDLVLLDVMMPGLSGLEVLKRLRADRSTPVLMVTALGDDLDRILGLELGADDYLPKPFHPRELLARVRAILRRVKPTPGAAGAALSLGVLRLEPSNFSATVSGAAVRLTVAEFQILFELARTPGRMYTRAALTERALGRKLEPYDRSIDTHISHIRRKLAAAGAEAPEIRSVRGLGYALATREAAA